MATSIKPTTNPGEVLSIIPVVDDAIDWAASFPDLADEEMKRKRYSEDHDMSVLVFVQGSKPTIFQFAHPARADISTEVRKLYTRFGSGSGNAPDLFREVFNLAYQGKREGLDGEREPAPKHNGEIVTQYFQGIEDAGIFQELSLAFIEAYRRSMRKDGLTDSKK